MPRIAAVDKDNKCVKVFDWDRTFDLVDSRDPRWRALSQRLGLKASPERWVDVSDRPDVQAGDTFPFVLKDEEPPKGA